MENGAGGNVVKRTVIYILDRDFKIKKENGENHSPFLSGYCDSNTGPSGPKPDALANCATPRFP